MDISEINLIMTCGACPEQYDAFDAVGNQIGHLRLRNGYFSVECYDCENSFVYEAMPKGDDVFHNDERDFYLAKAKQAIANCYPY